jgi:aminoglycoside phosphotransferase family enzyme/predicted kinase
MTAPPEQAEAVALLRRLAGASPVETHISLVFVGADTVWKLKKAVRLAFLDFSTMQARRRFTLRELELNKPAAPELYRDAVPIVRGPDGALAVSETADTDQEVVDWVLRMARVPPDDFLDVVAAEGRLTPALLDAMGDAVAAYHAAVAPPPQPNTPSPAKRGRLAPGRLTRGVGEGSYPALRHVTDGNAQSALDAGLPEAAVRTWQAQLLAGLDSIAPWLEQRSRDGLVRRVHGDLHLGNLCLWRGKPVPFDALEFDEAMATIDLGYDLTFLLMDLDQRVDRPAANRVLNRYVARTGDAELTRGLPVFLSLRAMVRAHVEAKRGNRALAERYLDAATAYLHVIKPIALAIGGLPGCGKSTVARALAPQLGNAPGALVLRSDEIRKRQHGVAPEQRLPQSAYSDAASHAVFAELAELARQTAAGGHAVIADATFIDPCDRALVQSAATAAGVPFAGLWLEAPLPVLQQRISSRQGDASDATPAVLCAAARNNSQAGDWISVDVSGSPVRALALARQALQQHVIRN